MAKPAHRETEDASPVHQNDASLSPVLSANGLAKIFPLKGPFPWSRSRGAARAVDGVTFDLFPGRTLSLVGESGCGKTTTGRMLLDLEEPTRGEVLYEGSSLSDLRAEKRYGAYRKNVQAVFQDPTSAQNPRRRVGALVSEPLVVNTALRGEQLEAEVAELLSAVGLEARVSNSYPHELSGGMRQRVAMAVALALNPQVVVLDEPVSSLDVSFQSQVLNLLRDIQQEFHTAFLIIAHDLAAVRYVSDDIAAMYLGKIVESGPADMVFGEPRHPYTIALLDAAKGSAKRGDGRERIILRGEVASPTDVPSGCSFHPRCWLRKALGDPSRCVGEDPPPRGLASESTTRTVACHYAEELIDPGNVDRLKVLSKEDDLAGGLSAT